MEMVLEFLRDVLSQPALLIGIMSCIGLIALKRPFHKVMTGTLKPILGYLMLAAGAGDTFCGSSLNYLVDHDFENLTEEQLGEMLTFANAAAALVTTKKGAIKAMPVKEEVLELIQK